ncbi:hypothetical protein CMK18_02495 [Candidatus Poribacteria bacterium]|nr:hypothetical protein [Candidatus Poribacteria bacterium]
MYRSTKWQTQQRWVMNNQNQNNWHGNTLLGRIRRIFKKRQIVLAVGGCLGIIFVSVIAANFVGKAETIEQFADRYKDAVESKNEQKFQSLWDPTVLRNDEKAKSQYREAIKRIRPYDEVSVQIENISHRVDPRNKERYNIDSIPLGLFKGGQMLMKTYRDLVITQKGIRKKWYLVSDFELRDRQEFPQSSEASVAVETSNKTSQDSSVIVQEATSGLSNDSPVDTQLKIRQVLGLWQKSWQNKDVETYMNQYADEAKITRVTVVNGREDMEKKRVLGKRQLRQGMQRLNKRYSKIEVLISNLQINGDTAVADVGFLQTYKAYTPSSGNRPAYRDFGTKTLILAIDASDGVWKIYKESWKNYKDVPDYPKL